MGTPSQTELIARDPDLARTFWSGANAAEGLRLADDERRRREGDERVARSECLPDEETAAAGWGALPWA